MPNPLRSEEVAAFIRSVVSDHLGAAWAMDRFLDLTDRGSHPCGIFFSRVPFGLRQAQQRSPRHGALPDAELKGLALLHGAGAKTPSPSVPERFASTTDRCSCAKRSPNATARTARWQILAPHGPGAPDTFTRDRPPYSGLRVLDGFFGPLHPGQHAGGQQRGAEFYAERRLRPRLREAVDSGDLPDALAQGVDLDPGAPVSPLRSGGAETGTSCTARRSRITL